MTCGKRVKFIQVDTTVKPSKISSDLGHAQGNSRLTHLGTIARVARSQYTRLNGSQL
jgi:hypothetical protein